VNVRKGLLDNSKNGGFRFLEQTSELLLDFDCDQDLGALGETGSKPAKGGAETDEVQHGGMHEIRESANFMDGVGGELKGSGDKLTAMVVFRRKGFGQSGESHFQGGQRLCRRLAEVASNFAAFVISDIQELAGKPPKFLLIAFPFSDVLRHSADMLNNSSLVHDGDSARIEDADLAIGEDEAELVFNGVAFGDDAQNVLPDSGAVMGMEHLASLVKRNWALRGRTPQHAVHLVRPRKGLALDIVLPASEGCEALGLREKSFALAQFLLRFFLGGDVLRDTDDAKDGAGGVGDGKRAAEEDANPVTGEQVASLVLVRQIVLDRGKKLCADFLAFIRMNEIDNSLQWDGAGFRFEAEKAEKLSRAVCLERLGIQFPASEIGEILGAEEQVIRAGPAKFVFL